MTASPDESAAARAGLRIEPSLFERADPSLILSRLNRTTRVGRTKLARSPVTIAFLEAALDLTDDLFSETSDNDRDGDDTLRPTLSYLSKPQVVARALHDHSGPEETRPTEGKFRDRWNSQGDFLADFTAYALIGRHWSLHLALSTRARDLLNDEEADFAQAVHTVAYEDLKLVLDLPAYRFQLVAAASAQVDSVSAESLARMYRTLSEAWCALYQSVFNRYSVVFRPGLTIDSFNIVLQAAAEGLGMRLLAGTNEQIMSPTESRSLLGTTALALFVAFIDPGDGMTIEEVVNLQISARRASTRTGAPE